MNIHQTDEDCLIIELSAQDMTKHSIIYNPEGLYSEREEKIFLHILKEHKNTFPFKNICVDILPGLKGGCVAVIRKRSVETSFSVFESDCLDNFIDTAKALHKRKISVTSSLYKDDICYRLVTKGETKEALFVLCEFSDKLHFGKAEKDYTESYMQCLIEDNALEVLSGKSFKL